MYIISSKPRLLELGPQLSQNLAEQEQQQYRFDFVWNNQQAAR